MLRFSSNKIRISRLILIIINLLLIWYFSWQAIYSNKGYLNYVRANKELEQAKVELDNLLFEKIDLLKKISLLNDSAIDEDMLDELARSKLGLASKSERVIIIKKNL
jgi:cell division protein FtsB